MHLSKVLAQLSKMIGDRIDHWVGFVFIFFFAMMAARGQGVLPSVMADEWHYSLLSRLMPLAKSDDPGFVYLSLMNLTNICGAGYLGCARVANVFFIVAGCFLIYLSARMFLTGAVSLGVAVLCLIAPENVYALFFMPESLYFMMFWLMAYSLLRSARLGGLTTYSVISAGVVIGLATLVKPHALFVAAGVGAYILFARLAGNKAGLRERLVLVVVLAGAVLVVKFAIGYVSAGFAGMTFFGARYSNMASENIGLTASRVIDLATSSAYVLMNHVTLLSFLYFVPLAGAGTLLFMRRRNESNPEIRDVALLVLIVLGTLLAVTSAFSASVAGTNPYDVIGRVHMRYYSFALPLLLILAGISASHPGADISRPIVWFAVILALAGLLGAARATCFLGGGLEVNWIDSPGLMYFSLKSGVRSLVVLLGVLLAGFAVFSLRRAAWLYLLIFVPFVSVLDFVGVQNVVEARKHPDTYDLAGAVMAPLLHGQANVQVTLVGPDEALLYRTIFYLDRTNSAIRIVAPGAEIDPAIIPKETTHILVFAGGHLNMPGFELALALDGGDGASPLGHQYDKSRLKSAQSSDFRLFVSRTD